LKFASGIKHVDVTTPKSVAGHGTCSNRFQLPIAKYSDSCYHCPFLYDDAKATISRSPGFQGTTLPQVAQALLPVRSCRTCKSTPGYSVDIATGTCS